MELTPEDDDLLSYFLSADVASEEPPPQLKADALNAAGTAPLYPTLGGGVAGVGAAPSGNEQFTFGAPQDRVFGQVTSATGAGAGAAGGSAAGASNLATPGPLSTLQQMQNAYHAAENAMMRSSSVDEDAISGAGLDSDEKRQRRLARNRESARQSRRRKKQYLELLEEKLTESIDATRASHLERADESLNNVRSEILATLAEDMKNNPPEVVSEKVRQGIMVIQERFGPNSVERMAVKDYNFRQLDNLLLPPYSRFLLWLSIQDESFFDEANGLAAKAGGDNADKKKPPVVVKKDTLWPTLIGDLALTYEQDEKLKSLYKSGDSKTSKSERRRIALAVTYLSKLKNSLEQRSEAVQRHTEMIHSILTPEQSLTYLRWVDANQDRLPSFIDRSMTMSNTSSSEAVRTILKKNDRDLTVEDVTALLAEL
ncbi:Tgacg-sequence-specific dna-binding protein tga-1b, partial [Globisporangium splendens]